MDDVAIVGIGMHPFGRHDGVSGMEQGAIAVRAACSSRRYVFTLGSAARL